MREIVHIQAGQCGNQIGAKVRYYNYCAFFILHCPLSVENAQVPLYTIYSLVLKEIIAD